MRLLVNGTAVAQSSTHDLGSGTYTAMTLIAAEALGLQPEQVRFELGDTQLPKDPLAAGSRSVASVGPAVQAAATAVRTQIIRLAIADPASPLHGSTEAEITVEGGRMFLKRDQSKGETYTELLKRYGWV